MRCRYLNCMSNSSDGATKMRVDLNHGAQSLPQTERSATENDPASSTSEASGSSQAPGVDQAQLSGAHTQVAALAAQAAQLPEVREERVQSLHHSLPSRRYPPPTTQVAAPLFENSLALAAIVRFVWLGEK